jgi:hypothetical protein
VAASKHLPGTPGAKDFSAVIKRAQELPGFTHEPEAKMVTVGFGHEATLGAGTAYLSAIMFFYCCKLVASSWYLAGFTPEPEAKMATVGVGCEATLGAGAPVYCLAVYSWCAVCSYYCSTTTTEVWLDVVFWKVTHLLRVASATVADHLGQR